MDIPKLHDYYWVANYFDGSKLSQYETKNGKQIENKYPNINREQLERFDLVDYETNKPIFSLWIHEGQQLIYRRRTIRPVIVTPQRPIQIIWLVGYQHKVFTPAGLQSFKVINYIYQDGSIALDNDRSNLELYPEEQ